MTEVTELTRGQWERLTADMTRPEMLDTVAGFVGEATEAAWDQGYSAGRNDEFRDVHDILHVRAANPYRAQDMPPAVHAPTLEGPSAVREGPVERSGASGGRAVGVQEAAGASQGRRRTCNTLLENGERCFLPAGHADGCLPDDD